MTVVDVLERTRHSSDDEHPLNLLHEVDLAAWPTDADTNSPLA